MSPRTRPTVVTTYVTQDGLVVSGRDAREVVRALRDAQWHAPEIKRDWMAQVAERIAHLTNTTHVPTYSSADEFLKHLLALGLLRLAD